MKLTNFTASSSPSKNLMMVCPVNAHTLMYALENLSGINLL